MNYEHYTNLRYTEDFYMFLFYSEGPKGRLRKLVIYSPLGDLADGYNLGFGTLKINPDGDEYLDGDEISDNGDRNKILATIALTAYTFLDRYPDKKIYLRGSNVVRTRLYQMAISHAYDELSDNLVILGDKAEKTGLYNLYPFEQGVNYNGFMVKKK